MVGPDPGVGLGRPARLSLRMLSIASSARGPAKACPVRLRRRGSPAGRRRRRTSSTGAPFGISIHIDMWPAVWPGVMTARTPGTTSYSPGCRRELQRAPASSTRSSANTAVSSPLAAASHSSCCRWISAPQPQRRSSFRPPAWSKCRWPMKITSTSAGVRPEPREVMRQALLFAHLRARRSRTPPGRTSARAGAGRRSSRGRSRRRRGCGRSASRSGRRGSAPRSAGRARGLGRDRLVVAVGGRQQRPQPEHFGHGSSRSRAGELMVRPYQGAAPGSALSFPDQP